MGAEELNKLIKHVESDLEDKYWREEQLEEERVEEFIIHVGGSDNESSSNSDTPCDSESDLHL